LAEFDIDDATLCDELALLLCDSQHFLKAKQLYEKAISLNPESGRLYFNMATVQRFLGETEDAIKSCTHAIELNKADHDAHFLRSSLTRQDTSNNHIEQLQGLLDTGIKQPLGEAKVCFALAKEFEDCADHESSFVARKRGADIYRQKLNYDAASDLAFIDSIIETYDESMFETPVTGHNNHEPIFIVGLPRSGTTLVERIISSHSDVRSAGELTNFSVQMINMMQGLTNSPNLSRGEMVALTARLDFEALGRRYIESTRPATGQSPHFVDKFPQNALYAGPIHLALPRARMVLLQRHPLDTCYSMYKQLFTDIYQFSYKLDELADYFIAHQKLMAHWQKVKPGMLHVVRYEDLVQDIETVTRNLLEYCGLEWQAQCLDFHRNEQASTTASASQVRQKLYASSIGMWRNYEKQLEPLILKLDTAGCLQDWPM